MPYTKWQADWKDDAAGNTPINEAAMDHIEAGIQAAEALAETKASTDDPRFVNWSVDPASANGVQRLRHSTENFLTNASFEAWLSGTSAVPDGWTMAGDVTVSRVTSGATVDTYAAQLVYGTGNTGEFYQDIGVSNLVDYTYSAYVNRVSGAGNMRLVAQLEGSPYTEYVSVGCASGTGQQLVVLTVKPTTSGLMRFSFKSLDAASSTWTVDECQLQESKGVATAFQHRMLNDTNNQNIFGAQTFRGTVTVPTPTAVGHAVTKAYADLAVSANPQPEDHGLIAWSFDPAAAANSATITNGTVYLAAVFIRRPGTITKVWWAANAAGVTPTSGQNVAGLFDSAGTLLSSVNIDTKVTSSSTAVNATLTSAQAVVTGWYWVGLVFNAATPPTLVRSPGLVQGLNNANLTAAAKRFVINGTSQTTLTAVSPASNADGPALWAAVS